MAASSASSSSSSTKPARVVVSVLVLVCLLLIMTPPTGATRPGKSFGTAEHKSGDPAKAGVVVRFAYNFLPKGRMPPSGPSKRHNAVVDSLHG